MEYRIFCDESVKRGKYFSNFYGGVLVNSRDLLRVEQRLARVCEEQHFYNEVKWQRVTEQYLPKVP